MKRRQNCFARPAQEVMTSPTQQHGGAHRLRNSPRKYEAHQPSDIFVLLVTLIVTIFHNNEQYSEVLAHSPLMQTPSVLGVGTGADQHQTTNPIWRKSQWQLDPNLNKSWMYGTEAALHVVMLILQSGDVELNPGPL